MDHVSEYDINTQNSVQYSFEDFQLPYRRQFTKNIVVILMGLALLLIFLPVISIIAMVTINGLPVVTKNFPNFLILPTNAPTVTTAGMANAIQGTIQTVAIASLIGVPIGILAGIRLAEGKQTFFVNITRFTSRVLVGLPSIVAGLIIYIFIVIPLANTGTSGFSSVAGGLALTLLIIPIIAITTEEALRTIPTTYREASLALGIPNYRINTNILIKGSMNIIITGIIIAIARISGETAPLIFTIAGNQFFSRNLFDQTAALPLNVYRYATSNAPLWVASAWGAAFILLLLALSFNFIIQVDTGKKVLDQFILLPSRKIYKNIVITSTTKRPQLLGLVLALNFILAVLMIAGSIITLTGGLYITLGFLFVIITIPYTFMTVLHKLTHRIGNKSYINIIISIFFAIILFYVTYLCIFQTIDILSFLTKNVELLTLILIFISIILIITFLIYISYKNKKLFIQNFNEKIKSVLNSGLYIYSFFIYLGIVLISIDSLYIIINNTVNEFERYGYRLSDVTAVLLIIIAIIGLFLIRITAAVNNLGKFFLLLYSIINFIIISTGFGFRMDSSLIFIIQLIEQTLSSIFTPNIVIINVFLILYTIGINFGLIVNPLTLIILLFDKNTNHYFKDKYLNNYHIDQV